MGIVYFEQVGKKSHGSYRNTRGLRASPSSVRVGGRGGGPHRVPHASTERAIELGLAAPSCFLHLSCCQKLGFYCLSGNQSLAIICLLQTECWEALQKCRVEAGGRPETSPFTGEKILNRETRPGD